MNRSSVLLLASSSVSRKKLLQEAGILFEVVTQDADESLCDWGLPLPHLVATIARYKMEHVCMPAGHEGDVCFVLTADTLSQDANGAISGKPIDRQDAITKIKQARDGMFTGTAFVLDKKIYRQGQWHLDKRIERFVGSNYSFSIPDEWIERYFASSWGLQASGAIAIEGFGSLFLKEVQGSYTAIVGLPMFELREALTQLNFNF